jgi:hypothetical protein
MTGAGLPVGRATRRSRAVQTARSALASGPSSAARSGRRERRVDWADSKPALAAERCFVNKNRPSASADARAPNTQSLVNLSPR